MGSVTYKNQPGIHKTRGSIPLAGDSRVYKVEKLLWPSDVEKYIESQFTGETLHICCGKSKIGDIRTDLYETDIDVCVSMDRIPFGDISFDTVVCDPPYSGKFQVMHDTINEAIRLARKRIVWQSWFLPVNKDGYLKKSHVFEVRSIAVTPSLRGHEKEILPCVIDKETGSAWYAEETGIDQFELVEQAVWQPMSYFGRAQFICTFERA